MRCPGCGNERVTTQQPCIHCGFVQNPLISQLNKVQSTPALQQATQVSSSMSLSSPSSAMRTIASSSASRLEARQPLTPATTLQNNHYLLIGQLEKQQWTPEAYEAQWTAQDRKSGNYVIICEAVLPLNRTNMQAFLRRATKALLDSSNHARVIPLQGIFMEHGRGFFVFPQPAGELLQARIQRMGVLPEEEIITCCLQVADILEFLSQQSPPVVHGSIRPDHIIRGQAHWYLTTGSIFAAGGATEFISYSESVRRSPYTAPEVVHGMIDTRSDIYSLMVAMFYAITRTMPTEGDIMRQAQMLNPFISKTLAAFLAKGLHPFVQERYQQPFELFKFLGQKSDYNQRETQNAIQKAILQEEYIQQKQ